MPYNISHEMKEYLLKTNVLKVKQCVMRANLEGYPISEHYLRQLIRSGSIPARQIGSSKTNLIFYPRLIEWLTCETGADNQPATMSTGTGIRRL